MNEHQSLLKTQLPESFNSDCCCVCLENSANINSLNLSITDCCDQKIHTDCLISWLICKGEFNCPLCRSENIRVSIDDLLQFNIITSEFLNINNKEEYIKNLNILLSKISSHYIITIEPDPNFIETGIETGIRHSFICLPGASCITWLRNFSCFPCLTSYSFYNSLKHLLLLLLYVSLLFGVLYLTDINRSGGNSKTDFYIGD
jgi:hypothetical protein